MFFVFFYCLVQHLDELYFSALFVDLNAFLLTWKIRHICFQILDFLLEDHKPGQPSLNDSRDGSDIMLAGVLEGFIQKTRSKGIEIPGYDVQMPSNFPFHLLAISRKMKTHISQIVGAVSVYDLVIGRGGIRGHISLDHPIFVKVETIHFDN